ncbi:Rieske 2Fe-2S domain-containing protein [Parafrankia sp. BMG5.11]|uniref:Rieske 2Fe-2S domain-containing protein n=1 Tax=Parafrankia sp. BMG5.11 TaxID=222540 RepID=UPI0010387E29|nr:Rieske 2Fe-2S domain-containing protein [Parafrankia sp. BMG5.11]TCJ37012.1 (2Fe-2S)-binding protein [Parafrankia sp. BMG5.11]
MAKTSEYGLGEFPFARGWYMIGAATEATSTPSSHRYFGKDLVLYRGESGKAYLTDAYCPHMGAHIARNKTSYIVLDGEHVEGESIRCPFHGWRFGPDGRCNHIPYSDFIPKAATLRHYPLEERAGILWAWHDSEEREPDYPLPDFGGHYGAPGWVEWKIDFMGDLDVHPVEVVDNMADFGHFIPIHGATDWQYFANEFQDHIVHQYYSAGHRTLTSDPDDMLVLDTWYTGPGFLQSEMAGAFDSFIMIANTPIEEDRVRAWHGLMVKVHDGSREITDEDRANALQYQEGSRLAFAQDVEIWANKRACINPLAVPADGPYGKLRRWYGQFHNPRDKVAGIQARVNGTVVTLDKRQDKTAA